MLLDILFVILTLTFSFNFSLYFSHFNSCWRKRTKFEYRQRSHTWQQGPRREGNVRHVGPFQWPCSKQERRQWSRILKRCINRRMVCPYIRFFNKFQQISTNFECQFPVTQQISSTYPTKRNESRAQWNITTPQSIKYHHSRWGVSM